MQNRDVTNLYDAIIIGGGPAGLTAALYLARAKYRVLVVEKEKFGGQITITEEIVNYPGIKSTSGQKLTDDIRRQAQDFGAEFLLANVEKVDVNNDIKVVNTSVKTLYSYGILIATGAHPRMVGFQGEEKFKGHGVAYCATCDGEFFTGKEVFVVGGGFAAAEEGMFLTKYAKHVTILVRGDDFRCAKSVADKVRANEKITVLTNTQVVKVDGDASLNRIVYKNTKLDEETTYEADSGDHFGVFVFAGYEPATEIFRGIITLDDDGYVVTDVNKKTDVDGVYAAGDVCIKNLRQVVTAVGDGALAATEIEKYAKSCQEKTGIIPPFKEPVKVENPQAEPEDKNTDAKNSEGLFSQDMVDQLKVLFSRMENPLQLKLSLDESEKSKELENYIDEMARLTDKLSVVVDENSDFGSRPCVRVYDSEESYTGLAFHGVPGGHEFTSFVLGLYNAAGPGQELDSEIIEKIKGINDKTEIKIMVSLTCTMCPDLVTTAQRIAVENDNISAEVYDISLYGDMKEKYNVMSVPCFVIGDRAPNFGRKTVTELLDIITG